MPCREHEVLRFILLEYAPHSLHKIFGMAPIPFRFRVSDVEPFLYAKLDAGDRTGYLAGGEYLASARGRPGPLPR